MYARFFRQLVVPAAVAFLAAACDGAGGWEEIAAPDLAESERSTVLVEEFTGQLCVNCPEAAALLRQVAKEYAPNVVVVGMHAAKTGQTLPSLTVPTADTYAEAFGIPRSAPHATINRQTLDGGRLYATDRAAWQGLIVRAVQTKAPYRIDLRAAEKDGRLEVKTTVRRQTEEAPEVDWQLWAVEDIRAAQQFPSGFRDDYFHHNVFRAALNGVWGEPLPAMAVGAPLTVERSVPVPTEVRHIANAKIVAFVYDRRTKAVLETVVCPLGKGIVPDDETPSTPDPPTEEAQDSTLWFTCDSLGGAAVHSGDTLTAGSAVRVFFTTMVSPTLFVHAGTVYGNGSYTAEITKLDHLDDPECGLFEVCAEGRCVEAMSAVRHTTPFTVGDALGFTQSLYIQYKINPARTDIADTYRVRIDLRQGEKIVTTNVIVFRYDPEKVQVVE